ncbi:MAG TPA: ArsA-related P-loop ATPase [Solirubrobacterales bacterium]|nr:ArsA-related P-loop ATPase [Solirubrobacterales bacterium]
MAALLDKRLAFVTGKGGVGKTTVAYALGLAAVAAGKRAIVCEIASQERGSALFRRAPIGFAETELEDGLWAISIDPDAMVREYLEMLLPVRAMASLLHRSNLFAYLAAATPGLREVVTAGKAYELTLDERRAPGQSRTYDVVIVDAPATGHGVGFLEAPGTFGRIARGGPLADQARRIEAMITDPAATGVAVVAIPEEMAVNESAELADALAAAGVALDDVIVNGLFPDRFSAAELARIRAADADLGDAALAAAIAEAERARTQRRELERLRSLLGDGAVRELPFLFSPGFGRAELERLAAEVAL